jgi:uncharacterized membrane protein
MDFVDGIALGAATLSMGLVAGFFYTFAQAVMPGLSRSDDRTFVAAFRSIDTAINNPWQLVGFGGALVFTGLAFMLQLGADDAWVPFWIAGGFGFYLVMLAITLRVHIPLNRTIQAAGDPDEMPDLAAVREAFESRWIRWNVARAVLSTAAFTCLLYALFLHAQATA